MLPEGVSQAAAAILVCASFFTSALTAAFGLGGGVALLVIMGYLLPVAALVPVHGVVQWASNAGRMAVQRQFVAWPAVIPFIIGSIAGALAGAPFVTQIDDPALKLALGVFIIAVTWARLPALANGGPAVMAAGGAGTTFLSMFFGATGPLTAAFFAKSFDDRRAYIASHAAAMTFQHALEGGCLRHCRLRLFRVAAADGGNDRRRGIWARSPVRVCCSPCLRSVSGWFSRSSSPCWRSISCAAA